LLQSLRRREMVGLGRVGIGRIGDQVRHAGSRRVNARGARRQRLANGVKASGLVASPSDGNSMIDQGAGGGGGSAETLEKVVGRDHQLAAGRYLMQVGKHKFRWVTLE
jgi:hypothetical protein